MQITKTVHKLPYKQRYVTKKGIERFRTGFSGIIRIPIFFAGEFVKVDAIFPNGVNVPLHRKVVKAGPQGVIFVDNVLVGTDVKIELPDAKILEYAKFRLEKTRGTK